MYEMVQTYTKNGMAAASIQSKEDLIFEKDVRVGLVNIYSSAISGKDMTSATIFSSQQGANLAASIGRLAVARVEYEV